MTKQDYMDLIEWEVYNDMKDKGLKRHHLNTAEYNKLLYEKALDKLTESS